MVFRTTVAERCLVYLLDRMGVREEDSGAGKLTQDSFAEALGVKQAHVSRALNKLCDKGYAKKDKIHARGEVKRVFAYFLTEKGVEKARELRQRLEETRVTIVDLEGVEKEVPLGEVSVLLPQRPRFSDLVARVKGDRLDLRSYHAMARSVPGREGLRRARDHYGLALQRQE